MLVHWWGLVTRHGSFLILYLYLGHCVRLWQFGIYEAEREEEEEEAQRAQEQRKD